MRLETKYQSNSNHINPELYANYLLSNKSKFNVTRASYIDGFSEVDIPVAIAYRPNSKVLSQSGGKGLSRTQALISALMESYECDAAERIKPDMARTSLSEIRKLNISYIHPKHLPNTLTIFDEKSPIDWTYCRNLFNNKKLLVPFDSVSLDFTRMTSLSHNPCQLMTSNGLASGENRKDAIFSAIFEIIERHSVTSNELIGSTFNNRIDPLSISSEIITNLIDKITGHDLSLDLYDVSLYDEFPTFSCYIKDKYGKPNVGWGSSNTSSVSLVRAITEANQARTIKLSGSREDMNKYAYLLNGRIIENNNRDPSNFKEPVIYNEKNNPFKNYSELKDTFKKYKIHDPLYLILDERKHMAAVRVIIPKLHGYNYPAYSSIIDANFSESIISYKEIDTHLPAAI